ncbi:hypothetical protein JCGZ_19685 [Jatropha curcas]|uniref:Uncharacterized protein n=1 Tax=Jatropha curcas TaxID=180498 RepID=A0A067LK21_JATCU|nr:hypothetical protein JCGZ_19685 [Jatropha curcas]
MQLKQQSASLAVSEPFQEVAVDTQPIQVVEDLANRLDDESRTYVEIGASDDEEEEDQTIMGTFRALSSAQPPVPPSLPSVPSSSTPLPGLVVSSSSSQSLTTPASSEPRNKLSLKHFVWEEAITAMLKLAWEKLCALRYADFTYGMRKSGKKQSETSGDGAGPSQHTGGSISAIETSRLLAKKYSREPTPMELFTYMHTTDHDGNTLVDGRALGVNENYSIARERVVSSQVGSKVKSRIDELALYLQAVKSEKKRKYIASGLRHHSFTAERQLAELRAHVMRMSGQHGASTSSSNPPPVTDRDVSTALHQPLPSPLDPDTIEDTLVTPADTTTHLADTLADATTLDRVEDRPRRFDCGPF